MEGKEELSAEEDALVRGVIPGYKSGNFCRALDPSRFVFPRRLDMGAVKKMEVYEDDVFIVTPPKCGTTWTQEIVWLLRNGMDTEGARVNQFYRAPFIEISAIMPEDQRPYPPEGTERSQENRAWFQAHSLEFIRRAERPRIIKTHLPLSMLPVKLLDKCKVIFVARNIKDAAVSYFYHCQMREGDLTKDADVFDRFVRLYVRGLLSLTPVLPSILQAWKERHNPNMLFYTYEELQKDFDGTASKIARFLNVDLPPDKMEVLKKAVSFDSIRSNPYVNKSDELGPTFIRKGVVGDWKGHFSQELNLEFDAWLERELEGSGYVMEFE